MTALNELIEIIKQKRNESEISNTLLRFLHDEAIRLLETEKEQQENFAIGFAEWLNKNYIVTSDFLWLECYTMIKKNSKELLEIYKKTL